MGSAYFNFDAGLIMILNFYQFICYLFIQVIVIILINTYTDLDYGHTI